MSSVNFGMECTRCGSVFGVMVGDSATDCSNCGGKLRAAQGAGAPQNLANYHCKHCNSYYGLAPSIGGDGCPQCGAPIAD